MSINFKAAGLLMAFAFTALTNSAIAAPIYATGVDWDGTNTGTDRTDPNAALGAEDNVFLSLGLGGLAVFSFGQDFTDSASVWEITYGNVSGYDESIELFAGTDYTADGLFDISGFTSVGTLSNVAAQGGGSISFSGAFTYLAIRDTSPLVDGRDGFDVDAVSVVAVPEPSIIALFGLGLVGLGFARRKTRS